MLYYAYALLSIIGIGLFLLIFFRRDPYTAIASLLANAIVFATSLKVDVVASDGTIITTQDTFMYHISMSLTILSAVALFIFLLKYTFDTLEAEKI